MVPIICWLIYKFGATPTELCDIVSFVSCRWPPNEAVLLLCAADCPDIDEVRLLPDRLTCL